MRRASSSFGAGHAVPTGEPLRRLVLLVRAVDATGQALPATSGYTVPDSGSGGVEGVLGADGAELAGDGLLLPGVDPSGAIGLEARFVRGTGAFDHPSPARFGALGPPPEERGMPVLEPVATSLVVGSDGDALVLDTLLGIIGVGAIGAIVAERARGLRMKVIASDPYAPREAVERAGVELVSLDTLYERSDFISIHVPLNGETRYLVGARAFEVMKDRVRIVNCARGGIIDEDALYEAIVSGKVAGAALDVFSEEPPGDLRLIQLPQVIATPHLGATTFEAQIKVSIAICEQVRDYLLEGTVRNAVNAVPPPR